MDVFKLAPQVAEETLEYRLYPRDTAQVPTTLRTLILEYVAELLPPGFIWHRDPFEIKIEYPDGARSRHSSGKSTDRWKFEGRMRVGDCVDDEWCAVWLLREISVKWDLAVSVHDSDGEFLLIEAADALPSWITPENANNRVWIYKGQLHIVPLKHTSDPSTRPARQMEGDLDEDFDDHGGLDSYINVADALSLVWNESISTLADRAVQHAAWNRVAKYPAALSQHIHRTKAYIPVDVARALLVDSALIQKAVEAFYTRDVLQLRAAQKMSRFPPKPDVLTTVSMTRPAYAQLVSQVFHPPKVFGVWQESEDSPERRWRDACGFEMMYAESKSGIRSLGGTTNESREARMDALCRDSGYIAYIQGLEKAGYFQGEISGSQKYKEREQTAADMYVQLQSKDDAARPSFAALVEASLLAAPDPVSIPGYADEDSAEWLNVDESAFDNMLEQRFNRPETNTQSGMDAEDNLAQEQAARLQELAKKVEGFVEGKGDLEGARFDDDILEDEDIGPDSDDESVVSDQSNEGERRQKAMDNLVAPLEPGDYGQMPASYSNSQAVKKTTLESEKHIPEDNDMPGLDDPLGQSKQVASTFEAYKTSTSTPHESGQQSTQKNRERPIRRPILPRDRFDGVDSDDEDTDPEDFDTAVKNGLSDDNESEEDHPTVVGDVEIDMDEEQEEFIRFSREALGIDDALWNKIMQERSHRGAFVPLSDTNKSATEGTGAKPSSGGGNEMHWFDVPPTQHKPRTPTSGPRPNGNPKLDSFEAVMEAMEAELQASRSKTKSNTVPSSSDSKGKKASSVGVGKGKKVRIAEDDDTEDIEGAMERELRTALDEMGDSDDDERGDTEVSMDYNLIKNFLESWKGQAGLPGPVGGLASRLQQGWVLPRDSEP
ncbi:SGT1-ecdysoneless-like protein [Ceratobasidium sp. AG-Ba]|nr:SGT1-ecdysoneless-like protein [Ceratobasidium sp. AG-Ba]QRW14747.1 SGT1-ecdysoneless-like protein [Ceratobasidium sp. AG-Ba]